MLYAVVFSTAAATILLDPIIASIRDGFLPAHALRLGHLSPAVHNMAQHEPPSIVASDSSMVVDIQNGRLFLFLNSHEESVVLGPGES